MHTLVTHVKLQAREITHLGLCPLAPGQGMYHDLRVQSGIVTRDDRRIDVAFSFRGTSRRHSGVARHPLGRGSSLFKGILPLNKPIRARLFLLAPRPKSRRHHINKGWAWFEAIWGRTQPAPAACLKNNNICINHAGRTCFVTRQDEWQSWCMVPTREKDFFKQKACGAPYVCATSCTASPQAKGLHR